MQVRAEVRATRRSSADGDGGPATAAATAARGAAAGDDGPTDTSAEVNAVQLLDERSEALLPLRWGFDDERVRCGISTDEDFSGFLQMR